MENNNIENNIENRLDTKKLALLAIVAAILIGVVIYVFSFIPKATPKVTKNTVATTTTKSITKEDALALFPVGFPIEKDAVNSTPPQISVLGNKQVISYNYTSTKTIDTVTKSFQSYFDKMKWKYTMPQDTAKLKVISLFDARTQDSILVTLGTNTVSNKTEASVVYSRGIYKTTTATTQSKLNK